jgi:molecular chaperone HscB
MSELNYFELFDLAVSFHLDEQALKTKYYKLSRKWHPDFFTQELVERQAEVAVMSEKINQAYKVLSDRESRFKYILELHGKIGGPDNQVMPADFLMEMMDINETIMDLQLDFDQQRYDMVLTDIQIFENELNRNVSSDVDRYDGGDKSDDVLENIKDYYLKSKYLLRIKENLSTFAHFEKRYKSKRFLPKWWNW